MEMKSSSTLVDSIHRIDPLYRMTRTVVKITAHPITIDTPPYKNRVLSGIKLILNILMATIVVAGNFLLFTTLRSNDLYTVRSGSMEPTLKTGSIILVQSRKTAPYKTGDIITFQGGNQIITHRIVEAIFENNSYQYQTQGDANTTPDTKLVPHNDILGRTSLSIPLVGYALAGLKTQLGFALIILLPASFVVLQEIRVIKKSWKQLHTTIPLQLLNSATVVILVTILSSPFVYAAYSASATLSNNQVTTAAIFPTPTPSPTVEPSPEPTEEPSATPTPMPDVEGVCDVDVNADLSNTNTGPGSTNENILNVDNDCTHTETNTVTVENNIDVNVNTGGNEQTGNTENGDLTSGDVTLSIDITNSAN